LGNFISMKKTIGNSSKLNSVAKPFLKWAGGKGQLLKAFQNFYPKEIKTNQIKNYYEPFIGGGAVFFDVVQQYNIRSAFLYDVNEELILTYRVIQQDVHELLEHLQDYKKKYEKLNEEGQSIFYYETRDNFNKSRIKINSTRYSEDWILRAAQIIFMNKTCFNGLFRFNLRGEFNVPVGRYKNPKILDEQNLINTSKLLEIAEIKKADFSEIENDVKENSFVYFDPPYRPISRTSSFTSYSKNKFEDAEQIKLAELFQRLHNKGIKQMLSNSDPKNNNVEDNFFDDIYKNFQISRIPARRMINSVASKRNVINEIVVTNYLVK